MANLDDVFAGKADIRGGAIVPFLAEQSERNRPKAKFKRTNTNELMARQFEPIRWIVSDYLPEGFSVLAGRQKLGKTWLAIDFALAVASGGTAIGAIDVEQGDVLYIDCENGHRRIQRRIDALYPVAKSRPDLSRLEWVTEAPTLDKGLIDALDDWRRSVVKPRLVVIDVLQRIKPAGNANQNAYEFDYSAWAPMQRWATEHGIAVLGLHHTRKGGADDPLEALSGSNGLSACADTTIVLDRDGDGTTLYVRGRDVDERESALTFTAGIWSLSGDASAIRTTAERRAILVALEEAAEPMSPTDLAAVTRMSSGNIRFLLHKMVQADEVRREARGRYAHPKTPANIANIANNRQKGQASEGFVKTSNVSDASSPANIRMPGTGGLSAVVSDVSDVSDIQGMGASNPPISPAYSDEDVAALLG